MASGDPGETSANPFAKNASANSSANWRDRVEAAFERWGYFVCRNAWATMALSLALTAWLVSFTPGITVDNSTESLLPDDDPAVIAYNAFRDEFSRDDGIVIAVVAPDLFDLAFLEELRALHTAFEEELPFVEEVDSLINARVTRGEGHELIVEELLEDWPESQADLDRVRELVRSNPLYEHTLISSDETVTALLIKPFTYSGQGDASAEDALAGFDDPEPGAQEEPTLYLTAPESDALMVALQEVLARHEHAGFELHTAGSIPMTYRLNLGMVHDLGLFLPVALGVMAILLGLLFRRVGGVVLPLLIVSLALSSTLGIMVMLGIQGSSAVQILPVFLLAVGVCDGVHILTLTYRARSAGVAKVDAIAQALGHSGLAVFMTSVTTAAGMSSFITAEMAAVVDLGVLAPIGVMLAFVYTMTLLPALLTVLPMADGQWGRDGKPLPLEGFLVAAGDFAVRHPFRILMPTALLCVLMGLGALQVRFSHDGLRWFPEDDYIRVDTEVIDHALGGAVSVDIVVDSRVPGGLYDPELLHRIKRIADEAPNLTAPPLFIKSTSSIVDIIEETHLALNENRPEMRRIPDTREAVAQELLLFEQSGSDDTEDFVDTEFRRARITLRVPFVDALVYPQFLADLEAFVALRLDGSADFELTGLMTLLAQIFNAVIHSMVASYAYALAVITPIMMLLLGSLRRGLVSMVPNLLPVFFVVGLMGWASLPLDATTILVGAMVIGLAVDDTIHFMHKFQIYMIELGDVRLAVRETLRTTGSALAFTSLVLAGGFVIFGLGEMANTRAFGLLAAFAAITAFLADLLVAPALLTLVEARRSQPVIVPETTHGVPA